MEQHELSQRPVVVKVGGSLFDLPDLGSRLGHWLRALAVPEVVLVPGGGPTTDVIRDLDRRHGLGEEKSHWLALHTLALNAQFLAQLLPDSSVVHDWEACLAQWKCGAYPILDPLRFARADEHRPGSLPHLWTVTSDSVAARLAIVIGARQLVLLKSVTIPDDIDWNEAGRRGFVDGHLEEVISSSNGMTVRAVNLREWRP